MHLRKKPKGHRFTHKIFMFYLDLDEIDSLCEKNLFLGHNRGRIYSFYDDDHMPFGKSSAKENVLEFLRLKGMTAEVGRIMLLTNLRTLGYVFNPLSIYFCFDKNDQPLYVVPEIGNTFGEIKPFLLDQGTYGDKTFKDQREKDYYISPFTNLDITLDFDLQIPDERLNVRVDDVQAGEKFFYASMTGQRKELNTANLLWYTLKFPFVTLKVIGLIHWHAFLLYLKGIPYHAKESNLHLQKEVLRGRNKH